jgi:hypothetical protein
VLIPFGLSVYFLQKKVSSGLVVKLAARKDART